MQVLFTPLGLQLLENSGLSTTLYIGLIDDAGYESIAFNDTMASHAGWTENTSYSNSTRPAYVVLGSSGGYTSNAPGTSFTMTASSTIRGIFLTTDATKGATTGDLIMMAVDDTALLRGVSKVLTALIPIQFKNG